MGKRECPREENKTQKFERTLNGSNLGAESYQEKEKRKNQKTQENTSDFL